MDQTSVLDGGLDFGGAIDFTAGGIDLIIGGGVCCGGGMGVEKTAKFIKAGLFIVFGIFGPSADGCC